MYRALGFEAGRRAPELGRCPRLSETDVYAAGRISLGLHGPLKPGFRVREVERSSDIRSRRFFEVGGGSVERRSSIYEPLNLIQGKRQRWVRAWEVARSRIEAWTGFHSR